MNSKETIVVECENEDEAVRLWRSISELIDDEDKKTFRVRKKNHGITSRDFDLFFMNREYLGKPLPGKDRMKIISKDFYLDTFDNFIGKSVEKCQRLF